jgi:hypothetical protein
VTPCPSHGLTVHTIEFISWPLPRTQLD